MVLVYYVNDDGVEQSLTIVQVLYFCKTTCLPCKFSINCYRSISHVNVLNDHFMNVLCKLNYLIHRYMFHFKVCLFHIIWQKCVHLQPLQKRMPINFQYFCNLFLTIGTPLVFQLPRFHNNGNLCCLPRKTIESPVKIQ